MTPELKSAKLNLSSVCISKRCFENLNQSNALPQCSLDVSLQQKNIVQIPLRFFPFYIYVVVPFWTFILGERFGIGDSDKIEWCLLSIRDSGAQFDASTPVSSYVKDFAVKTFSSLICDFCPAAWFNVKLAAQSKELENRHGSSMRFYVARR